MEKWTYVLNLEKKYEKIIKLYCVKNGISIKDFFKQIVDNKLKEISENEK